jgi:hypothetical protein
LFSLLPGSGLLNRDHRLAGKHYNVSNDRNAYRKQGFSNNARKTIGRTYGSTAAAESDSKLNFIVWRCRLAMNSSAD